MFYKAVWLLLHIFLNTYDILRQICCQTQSLLGSYDQRRDRSKEEKFLKMCTSQLSKIPKHLSIIIGPEETNLDDELILRLINYALWIKIESISLNDTRVGKRHCDLHSLETLDLPVRIEQLENEHIVSLNNSCKETNCHSNGNTNQSQIYKNVMQVVDIKPFQGHALIGDVSREMFKQRQSNEIQEALQERSLLTRHLEDKLSMHQWKCKDPELCIIFSKYMCTFGMLPWQMRFTEFHLYQHGSLFDARAFAKILFQYARCEQRWGK